jgi:hypothetical protein
MQEFSIFKLKAKIHFLENVVENGYNLISHIENYYI